ncbi:MAG: hypothetical protein IKQ13_04290 [Treponema sp.]|nr:hypothetical protein [Treponema sp.]
MEILEMVFGYILVWFIGAISILIGWGGMLIIRYKHSINEPFVIYSVILWEILWLIAVLVFIFYPKFYECW